MSRRVLTFDRTDFPEEPLKEINSPQPGMALRNFQATRIAVGQAIRAMYAFPGDVALRIGIARETHLNALSNRAPECPSRLNVAARNPMVSHKPRYGPKFMFCSQRFYPRDIVVRQVRAVTQVLSRHTKLGRREVMTELDPSRFVLSCLFGPSENSMGRSLVRFVKDRLRQG